MIRPPRYVSQVAVRLLQHVGVDVSCVEERALVYRVTDEIPGQITEQLRQVKLFRYLGNMLSS